MSMDSNVNNVFADEEEKNYFELIDNLESAVKENKLFFSNKTVVLEYIDKLRSTLPDEIKSAYEITAKKKQILTRATDDAKDFRENAEKEADSIIADAENKANDIIVEAQEHARELVSEHAIIEGANAEAEKIIRQADAYRDNLCETTHKYVVNILSDVEKKMGLTMESYNQLYENLSQVCNDVSANKDNFINYVNSTVNKDKE